jgi:hypothetical protein
MGLIKGRSRYQFSLQAVLIVVAIFACILVIGRTLPLGAQQFAICFSAVALLSSLVFAVLMMLDRLLAGKESLFPLGVGSVALVSICIAVILIVLLSSWLQLPLRSGTVQLAVGNADRMFVFRIREVVALSLLGAPVFCGILSMLSIGKEKICFRGWLLIGILSYLIAWYVIVSTGFIPMV